MTENMLSDALLSKGVQKNCGCAASLRQPLHGAPTFGDFGDFGVSDAATVAWRYTRRGGPRLSALVVLTRGP